MKHGCAVVLAVGLASSMAAGDDPWAAPAGYYDGATGTGLSLKVQLRGAMSDGHIQRAYGDYRNMSVLIDADPDQEGNILLVYNRQSVDGSWDSGATWNREHVWPQSRQPGSASNSSRGNLGDPHALRPANPSINSSRGNKPFGGATLTGGNRSIGSFYFPGDADKGDIARSLFYSDTRYMGTGISLVSGTPSGNEMGDLSALLAWHYLDIPDEFERRRNHFIYSPQLNPAFRAQNRNAFIDHPEFAWSVFVDQMNDTTLYFGALEPADGSSMIDMDLGNLLVGETVEPMNFALSKAGEDGTYYSVTASDGLSTSVEGPYDAFPIGGPSGEFISVFFEAGMTGEPGFWFGSVTVDNLDVTTQGGSGNGANDGDDIIMVSAAVFEPGNGSFDAGSDMDTMSVDLGSIGQGSGDAMVALELFNISDAGMFAAPIDIEVVAGAGDTGVLTTDLGPVFDLSAGDSAGLLAMMDDGADGEFSASYTLRVYNSRLMFPGDVVVEDLTLMLSGSVGVGCPADLAEPFGELNFFDVSAFLNAFGSMDPVADFNGDGSFDFFDVSGFLNAFSAGCP